MALIPTLRPFTMDGRYFAVGVPLTSDDAARVKLNPALLALCVEAKLPATNQPVSVSTVAQESK